MKLNQLISYLTKVQQVHGDINVDVDFDGHAHKNPMDENMVILYVKNSENTGKRLLITEAME